MSLKYIPKCVWAPIAVVIWMLVPLLLVFTCMLYKAKSVEVDISQIKITIDSTVHQIEVAQKTISNVTDTINRLTAQKLPPQVVPVSTQSEFSSELKMLDEQKTQLNNINTQLEQLKENLPYKTKN